MENRENLERKRKSIPEFEEKKGFLYSSVSGGSDPGGKAIPFPLLFLFLFSPFRIRQFRLLGIENNGVVRERFAVRSGRHSGGRNGITGGSPGAPGLRPCPPWPHQILPHNPSSPPTRLRGRLAPILRWRPPSCLVHQALPRLPRSDPLSLSLILFLFPIHFSLCFSSTGKLGF